MFEINDKVRVKNLPEGTHHKWAQYSGATGMICDREFGQVRVYFEEELVHVDG